MSKWDLIHARIIARDVIHSLTKMLKTGDPAVKPLVEALTQAQTNVNLGVGMGVSAYRLSTSPTMIGKLAGAAGIAGEVVASVANIVTSYQKTGNIYKAIADNAPQGAMSMLGLNFIFGILAVIQEYVNYNSVPDAYAIFHMPPEKQGASIGYTRPRERYRS